MLDVTFTGLEEAEEMFSAMPQHLHDVIVAKMATFSDLFTQKLKDDALSGGVLQSKTGALKDSVTSTFQDADTSINADVSVGEGLPYAAIQEYGGTTKAHIIEAVNAKVLAFGWQGKTAFLKLIHHPGSVIPAHDYMGETIDATQPDLQQAMQDAVTEGLSL